ncbi:MAG: ABC transporter permease, partial [Pseudomonadales bacterium]
MNFTDFLQLAWRSLAAHPLRTTLTMLGMIIGVASIIAMTSIGLGARHQVQTEIERLGTNLVTVHPIGRSTDALQGAGEGGHRLTEADAAALRNEVAEVRYAVPVVGGSARLIAGSNNWQTALIGTHPGYLPARDWHTSSGRIFTDREVTGSANVAVLGRTVAKKLSPVQPILDRVVRINDVPFRVIGILAERGRSANGSDQDDLVLVPASSARSKLLGGYFQLNRDAVTYILIKASSGSALTSIRPSIERVLRARHGIAGGAPDDFRMGDPIAALSASKSASETMTMLLACIAAVSLLVGGISIMNIMLVSVAERTREIGVRMAVGAHRADVRRQFLAEAAGVSLLGGAAGAALGIIVALLIGASTGWTVLISPWVCVGALSFSGLVGLL